MAIIGEILQDLFAPILAVIIGVRFYQQIVFFHRILLWQVITYLLIDLIALQVKTEKGNSAWLFNLYMPVETMLLIWSSFVLYRSLIYRYVCLFLFSLYGFVFINDIFHLGYRIFAIHAAVFQGVMLLGLFLVVIFRSFKNDQPGAQVFSMTGIVLYFSAVIPFLGTMFYIDDINIETSEMLFEWIVIPAQLLRYFLLALGFYFEARTSRKQNKIAAIP